MTEQDQSEQSDVFSAATDHWRNQEARLSTSEPRRPFEVMPEAVLTAPRHFPLPDIEAGWPPRFIGMELVRLIKPSKEVEQFLEQHRQNAIAAALKHPEVRELLGGASEVLGCHLVSDKGVPVDGPVITRVPIFNYTINRLIDVEMEDLLVRSIVIKEPWEHPESPVEVAQAINLAHNHPALKEATENLEANAILQVPLTDPDSPNYRHRCMYVMYTEQDDPHRELPPLFFALVDLNLKEVIEAGEAPCIGRSEPTQAEGQ